MLSLLALDEPTGAGAQDPTDVAAATLALMQALGDPGVTAPLWCLTRGAVNIGIQDTVTSPAQAALWGLGRAAALERPTGGAAWSTCPPTTDPRTAQYLLGVLNAAAGEDQLAVRRSGVYTRRLVRKPVPESTGGAGWQPRGTVLVTGGAEGLGRHAAAGWRRPAPAGSSSPPPRTRPPRAWRNCVPNWPCWASTPPWSPATAPTGTRSRCWFPRSDPEQPLTAVVHAADVTRTSSVDDTERG